MPHRDSYQPRRAALRAAVLTGLLALSACSTYQVRLPDSDVYQPESQAEDYETRIMHTYFWGLIKKPKTFDAQCGQQALDNVVVKSNYAMDLATVLTFGIWSPVEVAYQCRAPGTRPGQFPSSDSGSGTD